MVFYPTKLKFTEQIFSIRTLYNHCTNVWVPNLKQNINVAISLDTEDKYQ